MTALAGAEQEPASPFRHDILVGKVALITGGGSGIGLEIARTLCAHGCSVALMGRRASLLEEAAADLSRNGAKAIAVAGDVRSPADAESAVLTAERELGRLDILVNGAAGNFLSTMEELSTNAFRTVMEIDAVGAFNMSRSALPALKRAAQSHAYSSSTFGGPVIMNISATLHYGAAWYQGHAAAAKAAIDATTRSLSLEWGQFGVRVVGIAPGPVLDSPGLRKLAPGIADVGKYAPLGKAATSWDIAMGVMYIVSNAARVVTGETIVIDGGQWMMRPQVVPYQTVAKVSRKVEQESRSANEQTKSKL
eukprot:jgi/Chlat1/6162/Chrsp41S05710